MPRNKMVATILNYVWIYQDQDCYHFGVGHTLVHPRIEVACTLDQCTTPAAGRRRRTKLFPVGAPERKHAGKHLIWFYPTGIAGWTAQVDQKQKVGNRMQPERTQLLWSKYIPQTTIREVWCSPALPRRYSK